MSSSRQSPGRREELVANDTAAIPGRNFPIKNCMSVDVEEHFQVQAFASTIDRADWDNYESRVERNTDRILAIFDDAGIKATFFTLGWVAERHPGSDPADRRPGPRAREPRLFPYPDP